MTKHNLKIAAIFFLSIVLIIVSVLSIGIKTLNLYIEFGNNFLFFISILIFALILFRYYWKRWQRKKQDKILNSYPFIELITKGFIIEDNKIEKHLKSIQGKIENYHIIIVFTDIGIRISEISFFIEFHPKSNNKLLTNENLNLLISKYKKDKLIWKFYCLFYSIKIKNSEFSSFITKIHDSINILKYENLFPISEAESNNIKPEIDELIKSGNWDWKFV